MFLIAKGLGFLSRGKAAEKVCGVALTERRASLRGFAPASLPWAISSFLGELNQSLQLSDVAPKKIGMFTDVMAALVVVRHGDDDLVRHRSLA